MALQDVERMFSIIQGLAERFIREMRRYPEGVDDETWAYQATVHFFFCKAYKTYQALARLCNAGFVEDSEVLSRTLFELFLQTRWMSTDPKGMARLFAEHAPVRQYNLYLRMKKVSGPRMSAAVARIESKAQEFAEMKKQYDELKSKFLRPGRKSVKSPEDISENWWGTSIHRLAEKLGVEEQYATVYWSQSDLAHTGSTSIRDYLKQGETGWLANCYATPDNPDCGLTALWASGWFLGILEVLNTAWDLKLNADIEQNLYELDDLQRKVLSIR